MDSELLNFLCNRDFDVAFHILKRKSLSRDREDYCAFARCLGAYFLGRPNILAVNDLLDTVVMPTLIEWPLSTDSLGANEHQPRSLPVECSAKLPILILLVFEHTHEAEHYASAFTDLRSYAQLVLIDTENSQSKLQAGLSERLSHLLLNQLVNVRSLQNAAAVIESARGILCSLLEADAVLETNLFEDLRESLIASISSVLNSIPVLARSVQTSDVPPPYVLPMSKGSGPESNETVFRLRISTAFQILLQSLSVSKQTVPVVNTFVGDTLRASRLICEEDEQYLLVSSAMQEFLNDNVPANTPVALFPPGGSRDGVSTVLTRIVKLLLRMYNRDAFSAVYNMAAEIQECQEGQATTQPTVRTLVGKSAAKYRFYLESTRVTELREVLGWIGCKLPVTMDPCVTNDTDNCFWNFVEEEDLEQYTKERFGAYTAYMQMPCFSEQTRSLWKCHFLSNLSNAGQTSLQPDVTWLKNVVASERIEFPENDNTSGRFTSDKLQFVAQSWNLGGLDLQNGLPINLGIQPSELEFCKEVNAALTKPPRVLMEDGSISSDEVIQAPISEERIEEPYKVNSLSTPDSEYGDLSEQNETNISQPCQSDTLSGEKQQEQIPVLNMSRSESVSEKNPVVEYVKYHEEMANFAIAEDIVTAWSNSSDKSYIGSPQAKNSTSMISNEAHGNGGRQAVQNYVTDRLVIGVDDDKDVDLPKLPALVPTLELTPRSPIGQKKSQSDSQKKRRQSRKKKSREPAEQSSDIISLDTSMPLSVLPQSLIGVSAFYPPSFGSPFLLPLLNASSSRQRHVSVPPTVSVVHTPTVIDRGVQTQANLAVVSSSTTIDASLTNTAVCNRRELGTSTHNARTGQLSTMSQTERLFSKVDTMNANDIFDLYESSSRYLFR